MYSCRRSGAYLRDTHDIIRIPDPLLNRHLDIVNQIGSVDHNGPAQEHKER